MLIAWCKRQNNQEIWATVAASIRLWAEDSTDENMKLSETAVSYLEASPDPKPVLKVFASRLEPRSWSGSRAKIMVDRAKAFEDLVEHHDSSIAEAAGFVVEEINKRIDTERRREQRRDEDLEQRFE